MARNALIAVLLLVSIIGAIVFFLLRETPEDVDGTTVTSIEDDDRSVAARRAEKGEADEVAPYEPAEGPSGSLSGQVVDAQGRPVAGAQIAVGPLGRGPSTGFMLTETLDPKTMVKTTTDGAGRYTVAGCEVGKLVVVASSDVHPAVIRRDVPVADGEETQGVDFTLNAGREITGRVIDDQGEPLAGAAVKLNVVTFDGDPLQATFSPRVVSDADGRFRVGNAQARLYRASVRCPGHLPSKAINVGEGSGAADPVFELTRVGRIVVVPSAAESGAPLEDVEITCDNAEVVTGEDASRLAREALPQGACLVQGLERLNALVTVTAKGRARRTLSVRALGPGELRRLDVTLRREMVLSGRVLAADGTPIAGAMVTAKGRAGFGRDTSVEEGIANGDLSGLDDRAAQDDRNTIHVSSAETDAQGRFRIPGLPPGNFEVGVVHSRFLPVRPRVMSLDDDLPVEGLTFRLAPGGRLRATVLRGGRPVAGAWVVVRDSLEETGGDPLAMTVFGAAAKIHGSGRSNSDGQVMIYALPAGNYEVAVPKTRADRPGRFELLEDALTTIAVDVESDGERTVVLELP